MCYWKVQCSWVVADRSFVQFLLRDFFRWVYPKIQVVLGVSIWYLNSGYLALSEWSLSPKSASIWAICAVFHIHGMTDDRIFKICMTIDHVMFQPKNENHMGSWQMTNCSLDEVVVSTTLHLKIFGPHHVTGVGLATYNQNLYGDGSCYVSF